MTLILKDVLPKSTVEALMKARPENLILPNQNPESIRGHANRSGGWLHAPAQLDAGLAVESGYKVRYDAAYIPDGSPLAPGLVIDLGQPLERRTEPIRKSSAHRAQK